MFLFLFFANMVLSPELYEEPGHVDGQMRNKLSLIIQIDITSLVNIVSFLAIL